MFLKTQSHNLIIERGDSVINKLIYDELRSRGMKLYLNADTLWVYIFFQFHIHCLGSAISPATPCLKVFNRVWQNRKCWKYYENSGAL